MAQLASIAPGEEVVKAQIEESLTKVRRVDGRSPFRVKLIELHFSV